MKESAFQKAGCFIVRIYLIMDSYNDAINK